MEELGGSAAFEEFLKSSVEEDKEEIEALAMANYVALALLPMVVTVSGIGPSRATFTCLGLANGGGIAFGVGKGEFGAGQGRLEPANVTNQQLRRTTRFTAQVGLNRVILEFFENQQSIARWTGAKTGIGLFKGIGIMKLI